MKIAWAAVILMMMGAPQTDASWLSDGKYAGEFLSIGVDPRAQGMGGAYVALANGASAAYWNPAGLANQASQEVSFMHAEQFEGIVGYDYLGYGRRQYRRLRELEAFLTHHLRGQMDETGLGYRLRFLSGGMSPAQRLVEGRVIPERSGYYLGHRMVETVVAELGIARALRVNAEESDGIEDRIADQTA